MLLPIPNAAGKFFNGGDLIPTRAIIHHQVIRHCPILTNGRITYRKTSFRLWVTSGGGRSVGVYFIFIVVDYVVFQYDTAFF